MAERRADKRAYLSKQDGDYLVARGWATLDRNSGVYYVDRVRDGTVAVEDVEAALVRRLEGPRQPGACVTVNIDGLLAEFSPASTGGES